MLLIFIQRLRKYYSYFQETFATFNGDYTKTKFSGGRSQDAVVAEDISGEKQSILVLDNVLVGREGITKESEYDEAQHESKAEEAVSSSNDGVIKTSVCSFFVNKSFLEVYFCSEHCLFTY